MTTTHDAELAVGAASCRATRGPSGWGLHVRWAGHTATQPHPLSAEVWTPEGVRAHQAAYQDLQVTDGGWTGDAHLDVGGGVTLHAKDEWRVQAGALHLARTVQVQGDAPGGFLTAFTLTLAEPRGWPDVDSFAPGMLYGWTEAVAPQAIGGVRHYLEGARAVRIREDRLPAPLFGVSLRDGASLSVLNPQPRGDTTRADSQDREGTPLVDDRFTFAALGGEEQGGHLSVGLYHPGTEGEVTYLADTPFENGQFGQNALRRWRGRYHPLRDGFEQRYVLALRFAAGERDQDYRRATWRWAWDTLNPQVEPHDVRVVRAVLADALEASLVTIEDRSAPLHVMDVVEGGPHGAHSHIAMMGFTGRAIETGELLLRESRDQSGDAAERRRRAGTAVLDTFARLPVSPPRGEGVNLRDGTLTSGVRPDFYLRALAEGGKWMLRAHEQERAREREHPRWLAWCVDLARWLLTQEQPNGGFPRSWRDGTAEVVNADPRSSSAIVPFFLDLTRATGDGAYRAAALRAAELCWALAGSRGHFAGGTLDNANVLDKEAATLTLEAHLALFDATGDTRWLTRAKDAADFAETWIYLWNVPMPADEDERALHWKPGVTTVGTQLIATGHSLTDAYMAWDVANYARLGQLTHDAHYLDVARLLLHNTKTMVALPDRPFDLIGPGWQQEHWSFAPPRGRGQHRHWLPWVAASGLEGILALEALGPEVYEALADAPGRAAHA